MIPESREALVCEIMGALVPMTAALLIKMPTLELQAASAKAASTEVMSVMSVGMARTSVSGVSAVMTALVSRRGCERRPSRTMRAAPARAKYFAVSAPMPVPPPVITMTFPLADNSGRVGSIEGYGALW